MKTIFTIIAVLFALATTNAQDTVTPNTTKEININESKVVFLKALIEKNNLDLKIEGTNIKVGSAKTDFYNRLINRTVSDIVSKTARKKQLAYVSEAQNTTSISTTA